jgi:outer membrane protein, heavy metal efflux system
MKPLRRIRAALLLLVAGCQHVAPAPISPERSAAGLERRSLGDADLREALARGLRLSPETGGPERWGLPELTLAALYFHPDLRIARASAGVAAAHVDAAGQRPNPTLSVMPQRVANAASGISPWLAAIQFDWPIETAGKRKHRRAAAKARALAAELTIDDEIWRTRFNVYSALVDFSAARARRASLTTALDAQLELVALLERRLTAGAIAESNIALQRLALAQARAERAAAERLLLEARASLAAAVGVRESALDDVDIELPLDATPPDLDRMNSSAARRAALLGRSDVRAGLAAYAAAEEDLRLELAKQYPNLHLGPAYEFDQGLNKWGIVASLELPLANRNQGAIREALARRSEAAARFEALQAGVIAEVEAASASVLGARREWDVERQRVSLAQERQRLAEMALASGATDRVGLLASEFEAQRAASQLVDAEQNLHKAAARLERAVRPERFFAPAQPPVAATTGGA